MSLQHHQLVLADDRTTMTGPSLIQTIPPRTMTTMLLHREALNILPPSCLAQWHHRAHCRQWTTRTLLPQAQLHQPVFHHPRRCLQALLHLHRPVHLRPLWEVLLRHHQCPARRHLAVYRIVGPFLVRFRPVRACERLRRRTGVLLQLLAGSCRERKVVCK